MKIKIKEDFIKLDSLLKFANAAATGGIAKMMILNKQVLVNNEICLMRGKKIKPGDKVLVNGEEIEVFSGKENEN